MADRTRTNSGPATGRTRLKRTLAAPGPLEPVRRLLAHPGFVPAMAVGVSLLLASVLVLRLSRGHLLAAEGRALDETRAARVEFSVFDAAATERARQAESLMVPRVYTIDGPVETELRAALLSLPTTLAAAESLEQVAPEIRAAFALTADQFRAVRGVAASPDDLELWSRSLDRVIFLLAERPLLASEELQLALADPATHLEVRAGGEKSLIRREDQALAVGADNLPAFRELATLAGLRGVAAQLIAQRLNNQPRPLFVFDKLATDERRALAAGKARDETVTYRVGEVLARRGDVLTAEQLELLRVENKRFRATLPLSTRLLEWAGVLSVAVVISGALGLYLRLFYSRLAGQSWRLMGLVALLALGAAASCWTAVAYPGWLWAGAVAPLMLATMIGVVAFDPRLGFALAAGQAALVASALSLPTGYFAVVMAGGALAAWQLYGVRSRADMLRGTLVVALGLAISTAAVNMLTRPLVAGGETLIAEIGADALRAALAGFAAGAMTLMLLPAVERIFGVTTGMTLSEWRDPRQPLLKKLQLQAPGTYNHSHTVATLAEAAAEAIGADGLHVYVGALYHDIGKMNKPDYFVENQPRGFNRHAKLSPAMSLLVIVGHVKDGAELAREYSLPRSLHGYIETHHGTTLVEYFYDQARRQAEEGDDEPLPQEVEYRYPGPKPRTREQAILMVCDAVESATRALTEPTPSRIASLVHGICTKRLMDGQFDDCELTLADLSKIENAVARALTSIYHGRVAYPDADREERDADASGTRTGTAQRAG
jgi:cyclic-di-AMP phosphodiesterase PgpH